jgi:hypothetical protein
MECVDVSDRSLLGEEEGGCDWGVMCDSLASQEARGSVSLPLGPLNPVEESSGVL